MDFEEIEETEYDVQLESAEVQLQFPWGTKENPDHGGQNKDNVFRCDPVDRVLK